MKEIIIQTPTKVYEAVDKTRFNDAEECKKYEQSAKCVLKYKFRKLIYKEFNSYTFLGRDEDNTILAIKLKSEEDVKTISQYYCSTHSWMKEDTLFPILEVFNQAFEEKDIVLMEYCNDDPDNIWFVGYRKNFVENLNSI